MNPDETAETPNDAMPSSSLNDLLGQNEVVSELVLEAAVELSSMNVALKQELAETATHPAVEMALEKSEAVEGMVQEASEKLSVVNLALQDEVHERNHLEGKLAAVTEQGAADRHAALHDELTGLPNRALLNDRLAHGIAQAKRHDRTLAVMFVDLDHFKAINDTHGHEAGDNVLRTVARRLEAATRSEDTVSRIGGDEFLCLLMEVQDEPDVASIARKLVDSIQTPCRVTLGKGAVHVSVKASVGIAIYPKCGDTAEALVRSADSAMYYAKRAGSGYSFAS